MTIYFVVDGTNFRGPDLADCDMGRVIDEALREIHEVRG
jgi:hypothetical protein